MVFGKVKNFFFEISFLKYYKKMDQGSSYNKDSKVMSSVIFLGFWRVIL